MYNVINELSSSNLNFFKSIQDFGDVLGFFFDYFLPFQIFSVPLHNKTKRK